MHGPTDLFIEQRIPRVLLDLIIRADRALAEDIVRWSLEQMAYYKAPGWICFVDSLPLTATEKIQRGGLKEFVAKLMHDGAFHDLRDLKKRQV